MGQMGVAVFCACGTRERLGRHEVMNRVAHDHQQHNERHHGQTEGGDAAGVRS